MEDTQWPRFYVFEQPEEGRPFIHAGSVHAPDAEMALLIARDVFGRRPQRTAMWVVRDRRIFSRTREELAAHPVRVEKEEKAPAIRYQVFAKTSHKGVCVHAGEMAAAGPEEALALALRAFRIAGAFVWWVIADRDILCSAEEDRPVLFDSSPGKDFRHENHYAVRTMMLALKKKRRSDPLQ